MLEIVLKGTKEGVYANQRELAPEATGLVLDFQFTRIYVTADTAYSLEKMSRVVWLKARVIPLIFVCENNLYATVTRVNQATKTKNFADRGAAYNVPGILKIPSLL